MKCNSIGNIVSATGDAEDHNHRFTGKPMDGTGLYYYGARFYDPTLGRFINMNPAKDGNNWWVYVNNNLLRYVDPDGMSGVPWLYRSESNGLNEVYSTVQGIGSIPGDRIVYQQYVGVSRLVQFGFSKEKAGSKEFGIINANYSSNRGALFTFEIECSDNSQVDMIMTMLGSGRFYAKDDPYMEISMESQFNQSGWWEKRRELERAYLINPGTIIWEQRLPTISLYEPSNLSIFVSPPTLDTSMLTFWRKIYSIDDTITIMPAIK